MELNANPSEPAFASANPDTRGRALIAVIGDFLCELHPQRATRDITLSSRLERDLAVAPVYGLAENSVALAFPPPGRPPVVDRVDREALTGQGIAAPARADDRHPLEIVSCGPLFPGDEIRIVDELGRELGERCEGRLEFRGPSATSGYFRNEAKSRELIHDGWLDSGDRAYVADGEVYLTGRIKDIIIRAGRHIHPQEIEEAVAEIPGIRKAGVAVFGVTDRASGTERVVLAGCGEPDLEELVKPVSPSDAV